MCYNKSMLLRRISKILIILSLLTSCSIISNKSRLMDAVGVEDTEVPSINEYKYMINISSNKVHTFECGNSRIRSENNKFPTNDKLINILSNDKYDVCHICYAGLRKNKSITEEDCVLVEKYMRLYEFLQNDDDTCEFLMSIFEIGNWYVNNVYTYQGGLNTVSKIDSDAKRYASDNAQNKWNEYKTSYSELMQVENGASLNNKKIQSTTFNGDTALRYSLHKCDLFTDRYAKGDTKDRKNNKVAIKNADNELLGYDWKNYYVSDDCSKFAAAVYYNYINKTILNNKSQDKKDGNGIDLWYTGSYSYRITDSRIMKTLTASNKFKLYSLSDILAADDFDLKPGDLLYRKEKAHYVDNNGQKVLVTDKPGHVDFYIGNDSVVNWGRIHKSNIIKKHFIKTKEGYISNNSDDEQQPFVAIIRRE